MSETTTDRVELTAAEREQINAAIRKGRGYYQSSTLAHAAVGSIVAARVQALTAERDQWKFRAEIRSDLAPMMAEERDAARAELAAANTRLQQTESEWRELAAERDAANARCAELEANWMRSHEAAHLWEKSAANLQATLDRVTAETESVIDAIEETFLPQLPSKALSYCAQEDVNAGLDAMRERFWLEAGR